MLATAVAKRAAAQERDILIMCAGTEGEFSADDICTAGAIAKATLVVMFFMHAKGGNRLVWIFIAAGVVWLVILIAGSMHDVLTRGWF